MSEDYYQILGVSRDCDQQEIKQAYRRLARRYHPDVCKDDGAEEHFKQISQAYAVLSDPQKRRKYDRFGEDGLNGGRGNGPEDVFDLFTQVFGNMGGPFGGFSGDAERRGRDLQYEVTIDLEGVLNGVEAEVEVTRQAECDACGGTGAAEGTAPSTCRRCGGRGYVAHERQTLLGVVATTSECPDCNGRGTVVETPCEQCRGHGVTKSREQVLVSIPPGIQDGQRIRMAGHGDVPAGGGVPGDLLVQVRVQDHPVFERRDRDLVMHLDLSFSQAALGDSVTVPTLEGETEITVQPGAQTGDKVRLDGYGLPPLHGGRRGTQVIDLNVVTPTNLDEDERRLLMEFALHRGEDLQPAEHTGLFDRLRQVLSGEG